MDKLAETRAQWSEQKKAKCATLEAQHRKCLEDLYGTLMRRNQLRAIPLPKEFIELQCQAYVTSADLAALVDTLEGMGKIDRVDYVNRCVERFALLSGALERAK